MLPSNVRSSLGGLLSTVQCLSFHGIMLVPAPAVAHELGVGGTAEVAEVAVGGAQGFAGADGAAAGDASPYAGPLVAPNAFPVVVDPNREFMKVCQGSGGGGGSLNGDPNWPEIWKVGMLVPLMGVGPTFVEIFLISSSNFKMRAAASAR